MLGTVIGSYRILSMLGEGGMGTVYLAEHTLLGRRAAVKVLLRELSNSKELVGRFFNEARAATAVRHPGIVEIYDFGYHTDGSAFIVMEYLDGESLAARMRRLGRLSEAQAARLCRQVAGALEAAHGKGIVHRDLKPDNIFVVADGEVADGERTKVLDFGIAKLGSDQTTGAVKTRTGIVIGTPLYMAPEQCKGAGEVDARADLYSLGCILYEMVCARPPFVAEGSGEIMAQHIYAPVPPPGQLAPVSPALERLLLRVLAKQPGERYASARELASALQAAVPASGVHAPAGAPTLIAGPDQLQQLAGPPTPTTLSAATGTVAARSTGVPLARERSRLPLFIGGAGILAALAGVAFQLTRGGGEPAAPPAAVVVVQPPPPQPSARPTPPPAPPAPGQVAPTQVKLHIASRPGGAEVYRMPQGIRVGVTPLELAVEPVDGELVFVLRKPGYRELTVAIPARRDGTREVALERKPGPVRTPPCPRGPGSLDPFEKLGGGKQPCGPSR